MFVLFLCAGSAAQSDAGAAPAPQACSPAPLLAPGEDCPCCLSRNSGGLRCHIRCCTSQSSSHAGQQQPAIDASGACHPHLVCLSGMVSAPVLVLLTPMPAACCTMWMLYSLDYSTGACWQDTSKLCVR